MKKKVFLLIILLLSVLCIQVKAEEKKTMIYIDYPQMNEEKTNTLKIQGWYLTKESNTKLEIYVDETKIEGIERVERKGIFDIIKDYGDSSTNEKPGYYKEINIENYSYGNHTLKINVLDKDNNLIKTEERVFKKASPKTMINIDYPLVNELKENTLKIQGWYLTTGSNTKLEIYIDETKIEGIERVERKGIFDIIKDYGDSSTNEKPGYYKEINIENYSYGNHKLKINVLDRDNKIIKTEERVFRKASPKTMINIDYPLVNELKENTLKIQGWYLTTGSNTKLEIYIDETKIEGIERVERKGIFDIIKDYGDSSTNEKPGYYKNLDIKEYSSGNHKLKINVLDKDNQIIKTEERIFRKAEPKTLINIDYPKVNEEKTNTLKIQGWYLTTGYNTKLEIYIDETKIEGIERVERKGIFDIIKDYGDSSTNEKPGYYKEINIENYSYGNHKLKINVLDRDNKIIKTEERVFKRKTPESLIYIDFPNSNKSKKNIYIKGWYLVKTNNNTHTEVYIDNQKVEGIIHEKRNGLIDYYPAYSEYYKTDKNPGYVGNYDASALKDGNHSITIKVIDEKNNDVINTLTKSFKLEKYSGVINLDFPALANVNKDIDVVGWEMSELDNSYLKIHIDNKDISNTVERYKRDDVVGAIKNYGDASVNENPGFSTKIKLSDIGEGKHTLKIELYTKLNEKIDTLTKDLYVFTNIYNGIDVSSYNNVYSWQSVKNSGVDYIIARAGVRGYGTAGNLLSDPTFSNHVNQATMYGIKAGAYIYSQAITEAEGVAEVNLMIQQVNSVGGKAKVTLPLVIDTEFSSCPGRCGRADGLSREQRTRIVKTMAETIKANGYTPMIYASTSFLNNQLDMRELREYSVWVAHYGVSQPTYKGPYEIWQYTSEGHVTGVNGVVDMNYVYKKY